MNRKGIVLAGGSGSRLYPLTRTISKHPEVSRSGLDRCLRRQGVSNLKALMPQEDGAKTPVKPFKAYDPGFVHVNVKYLPQMPDEDHRQYLFAAIDRATMARNLTTASVPPASASLRV